MNNPELDKRLQAARGPDLDPAYQETFPDTVLGRLRPASGNTKTVGRPWGLRLAWATATAVFILIAFAAGHRRGRMEADRDVLADAKLIQETLAEFPNRVRAVVRDGQGINVVLSERADVPLSPPIYVRICDGSRCSSVVTFSGQEIQIAGQKVTVLSEANGGIILEGNNFVWSEGKSVYSGKKFKIQAKNLGSTIL
jgi:hypothetical protein